MLPRKSAALIVALSLLAAPLFLASPAAAAPQPLTPLTPQSDGLTGAPDLLRVPILGAPIPPRVLESGDRPLLQDRLRQHRRDQRRPRRYDDAPTGPSHPTRG